MRISTSISLEFASAEKAHIFYQSFIPEFNDMPMKRSSWTIRPFQPLDQKLTFDIKADDATAFRATINSLIQFASIVERTFSITEE